ncbi:cadherin-related family member 5 [Brachionichthys hirsutus]|uniref:cadherin-related family member 5 n=1 Tax=Brachionichthys hirsutus TaxID=412623 RepID=UPI00360500ED
MALSRLKWRHKVLVCSLVAQLSLHTALGMSGWGGCLDGQDVFATVRENSISGEVVADCMTDAMVEGVHWRLGGQDADWFLLDERYIRLNVSEDKVLDREVLGPVLMAELSCYVEDTLQSAYRILVEILDENDNCPVFTEGNALSLLISELMPVNTVIFTVQATDADNDKIIYSIDETSPDAEYFKVDLPNSGEVILSKPLDYERKTMLSVTVHASEMNTVEHFNTSTSVTITVLDGDDQYPQFLPCVLLFQDETSRICTSPVYMVNVTEGEEDIVLDFSPGPIHAVDGDIGLSSPVSYAILSGGDIDHFLMDRKTGEMKLIQAVRDRLETPSLHLQVMAYQDDDPKKYSVATVFVRVLAVNRFYPQFDTAEYKGFVAAGKSPASLVNTYGSVALMLHVHDQDFKHGVNPMVHFTFSPTSNHTDIYQITQEGLLISRTSRLKPKQKHVLEVMAVDQESGDATFATVVVEVLDEGQTIPHSRLGHSMTGCAVGKALFLSLAFTFGLGCILSVVMWLRKKHKGQMDTLERGCVAQGKHPNVSLRWFQLLSYHNAHEEELSFGNDEYGSYNPSFSFTDRPDTDAHRDLPSYRGPASPRANTAPDAGFPAAETRDSPVILDENICTPTKSSSGSPTFQPNIVDMNPKCLALPKESLGSPTDSSPDLTEALPTTSPSLDTSNTPPFTRPDAQNPQTSDDGPTDPANSPSSQSSILFINARIASAEIEKPFCKPCLKTPPYSPLPKPMGKPPPTPDHAPFKAKLVHIDPFDSPRATPEQTSPPVRPDGVEPSTSLDQKEGRPGGGAETGSSPWERGNLMNLGSARDCCDVDDDGFLGDEDADKNSDGESELDAEDEELLRALARCNPIFLTISK